MQVVQGCSAPLQGAPKSVSAGVHSTLPRPGELSAPVSDVASTTSIPVPTGVLGTTGTLPLSGQIRGPSGPLFIGSLGARPTYQAKLDPTVLCGEGPPAAPAQPQGLSPQPREHSRGPEYQEFSHGGRREPQRDLTDRLRFQ